MGQSFEDLQGGMSFEELENNSSLALLTVSSRGHSNTMNTRMAYYAFLLLCIGGADAKATANNPSFMIASGITSSAEMCLTVADGASGSSVKLLALSVHGRLVLLSRQCGDRGC